MADSVTLRQALTAQKALRDAIGLSEERFPMAAFIGMVSDEIEQARTAGLDDTAIARLLSEACGMPIDAGDIAEHYATPEQRGHP